MPRGGGAAEAKEDQVNGFWDEVGRMGARIAALLVLFIIGIAYVTWDSWMSRKMKEPK